MITYFTTAIPLPLLPPWVCDENVLLCPREGVWGTLGAQGSKSTLWWWAGRQQTKALQVSLQTWLDQTPSDWLASGVPNNNRLLQGLQTKCQLPWSQWLLACRNPGNWLSSLGSFGKPQQRRPKKHSSWSLQNKEKMIPEVGTWLALAMLLEEDRKEVKAIHRRHAGLLTERWQGTGRKERACAT